MSLYALTQAAVQGLKATVWGKKIPVSFKANDDGSVDPVEGGDTVDTGVQDAINALVNRLSSQDSIDLPSSVDLNQPKNAPAIRVFLDTSIVDSNNLAVIQFIDIANNTVTNIGIDGISNTTYYNSSNTTNNITNVTDVSNITNITNNGGTGYTGSLAVVTNVGGSIGVVGCDVTISLVLTTSTITFEDGSVTGVA